MISDSDKILFDQLWVNNVNEKKIEYISGSIVLLGDDGETYDNFGARDRNPYSVFKSNYDEDSEEWNFENPDEVEQILNLVPSLPDNYNEKILFLFNRLPFWLEVYALVEDKMYQIDPKYVQEQWLAVEKLISLSLGGRYDRWTHQLPAKMRVIKSLIRPTNFTKELCKQRLKLD